jgi:hypothetical protein
MVKRYKRGNKKQYIKEGHSIQWSKDTKEVLEKVHQRRTDNKMVKRHQTSNKKQKITSLVSFDHCIVCPSLMYCFLLPL